MIDDGQILELINNRKTREKGFRLLISQTKEHLYRQIRQMVLSHDDTDDIIQEVYIKVFRNISSFKGESTLSTWIYRIAYNETINFLKSKAVRNRNYTVPLENAMEKKSEIIPLFDSFELTELIKDAVNTLPEKQKRIFTMRYYDNIPFKQMQTMLNTTEGALKASYHIAESKIKDILLQKGLNL